MKKSFHTALLCSVFMLSFGLAPAGAQESVSASEAENGNLWFVELSGGPTADGNSLANVRAEKAAFKKAAAAAGISYVERRSFDVLFNGYSIEVDTANRLKLQRLDSVKSLWPVDVIQAPEFDPSSGEAPDLASAIAMTGANIAQTTLGITGAGVRVAVMDTGVDYDHADLGGDGVQRSNSAVFPTGRVIAGWDFVGDAFNADSSGQSGPYNPIPTPDAYPDDCGGHGSHVAGIVGANGTVRGVAPDVSFGAYRVFGCNGSTTADIMIAAMERALADGMQVLNMSIGSSFQWPQYPTGAAATRLVNKGVAVVASIGNSGPQGGAPNGLYSAGAPGTGTKVIGVASFDNTHTTQKAFRSNPDNVLRGYNQAAAAPPAPASGSLPLAKTGTTTTTNDGCPPWQTSFGGTPWAGGSWLPAGSLTGMAALVRRGTCSFYSKALNAQSAGAAAVVLYNNAAGELTPTVAGSPPITIPVVFVTAANGAALDALITVGGASLTWTSSTIITPLASGGRISGFSSFGVAADLSLKPDIGAPGGSIFSTVPIEQGRHANNSGTSMSSPHVAGAAALMLQARPNTPSNAMRARLQNSADPAGWWNNPVAGLDNVHRQGAGMLDIDDTILATVSVEPGKLSLGESGGGSNVETLTIRNDGSSAVTFDLSHAPALATGPQNNSRNAAPNNVFTAISYFNAPSTVAFSAPSVSVPAGGSASFQVTITPNAGLPERGLHGGYIMLTPQGGGQVYRVPYAGLKGDYQTVEVLVPTANGYPWLVKLNAAGTVFTNQPGGASYTMAGNDIPFFLVHLDHQSRRVRFEAFDAVTGKAWHRISDDQYVGRNSAATTFFAFSWDGTTFTGKGKNTSQWYTVPNGQYIAKLSVLKALGDENNPAHWETWTSPVITIARP